MPNAPTRNSVTFENLDPATEYEATITTEISDASDPSDVVSSNPVILTSKTNEVRARFSMYKVIKLNLRLLYMYTSSKYLNV